MGSAVSADLHCPLCLRRTDNAVLGTEARCGRPVRASEVLARQGSVPQNLFLVREGTLALRAMDTEGRAMLVDLIHPGGSVGFHALMTGERQVYSVEALGDGRICVVPKEVLMQRIKDDPGLHDMLIQHTSQQVTRLIQRQVLCATMNVAERMATLLLELRTHFGEADNTGKLTIRLPLSRQDMAAFMNTVPETISRTIRELEGRNVAHFEGRVVTVPDLDTLMDAAGRV